MTHERDDDGVRGPWRITFDTNPDICNLQCVMCEDHSVHSRTRILLREEGRKSRVMPFDLLERTLREAAAHGLREVIPSTMGEPLVYDQFDALLSLCRELGLRLNLTTNGTFPRIGARAWARKLVDITSDVKISWNGATAATHETIMKGVKRAEVERNLVAFIEERDRAAAAGGHRCSVTLQMTFMHSNVNEIPEMIRQAAAWGVDRVKGHHLWAHFGPIECESLRADEAGIRRWNEVVALAHGTARAHPRADGVPVRLENFHPLDPAQPEDIAVGGDCPFLGQEAWVSAEGRFNPCCAPDLQRRTLGEFGDLGTDSLMSIWEGEPYRHLQDSYRDHALCVSCNMRRPRA